MNYALLQHSAFDSGLTYKKSRPGNTAGATRVQRNSPDATHCEIALTHIVTTSSSFDDDLTMPTMYVSFQR